jgi:glutamate-ammonia-ligase adenylyltransferase
VAIGARFEAIRESVLRQDRAGTEAALKDEVLKMRQRMHDAHPNRSELFDLKQDPGGMIDIEFIVQYLVLRHACQHPQLTANAGNIALLHLCGKLGLVDAALADAAADAYRDYRRLQHQVRLQGQENARVEPAAVAARSAAVVALWAACFGSPA